MAVSSGLDRGLYIDYLCKCYVAVLGASDSPAVGLILNTASFFTVILYHKFHHLLSVDNPDLFIVVFKIRCFDVFSTIIKGVKPPFLLKGTVLI